ncbi:dihydrofolate reductase family protein [Microbacterium sp. SCN 71-21]|uniref:dihydrofolate reductase family protein n=1 Tax=Microbacterium sp. SCN 71-21 TaxID=1660116 RepID=UPI000A5A07B0|nr:dihydrofolate reductase family protein [Microbacterium sp. SCN 71-21]
MTLLELEPRTLRAFDTLAPGTREALRHVYAPTADRFVRLNMITSLTGAAAGDDGTSESLTNRVDRLILGIIRELADVVVVGAQSVRAEGYIVPRRARLAIVTSSGDLTGHRLALAEGAASDQVIVICPADRADAIRSHPDAAGITVLPVPGPAPLSPRDILTVLAEEGHRRVVCEGGPSLASQFAAAGVIDEYCLTVAPVLEPVSSPFLRLARDQRVATRVVGHLVDETGFTYLRLRPAG